MAQVPLVEKVKVDISLKATIFLMKIGTEATPAMTSSFGTRIKMASMTEQGNLWRWSPSLLELSSPSILTGSRRAQYGGGNYIWIYELIKNRYYYYAHLNEIFFQVGQIVSKGASLGTVGRTGVKAYLRSSPTHLHLVIHQSINGYPKPVNPYLELIRATNQ